MNEFSTWLILLMVGYIAGSLYGLGKSLIRLELLIRLIIELLDDKSKSK